MADPVLNPDGFSVKGCTTIYASRGQAGEYSRLATNPYRGCGHGCAYCYVPKVLRMDRKEFDAGAEERPNYLHHLSRDAGRYQMLGVTEQVMLSFTSDPYHTGDTSVTRTALEILARHGLGFCTLTKGGTKALRDLPMFRPDRDAFASTLTSLDDRFSLKWERNAALPGDRIQALRKFFEAGIFTWVSLEPTLNCAASIEIVEATHEFVNLYKIGRVNYLPMTQTTDWRDYTMRMLEVFDKIGSAAWSSGNPTPAYYFKKDLQPYLPAGLHNPAHRTQHH